jgi:hypothetical protein
MLRQPQDEIRLPSSGSVITGLDLRDYYHHVDRPQDGPLIVELGRQGQAEAPLLPPETHSQQTGADALEFYVFFMSFRLTFPTSRA